MVTCIQDLDGIQVMIVPGTQVLSDYHAGMFGWTYQIFKWSVIAR